MVLAAREGVERPRSAGIADTGCRDPLPGSGCHLLDRDQPIEQIITIAPLAAFEVLSPEDRVQRLQRKLEDYRLMGIPQIWVINPADNSFSRYVNGELLRSTTFSLAERGIVFDMREIQNLLD
jgi:Putative restriction endonuclease